MFTPSAKEKADLNTLVHHLGLFVLVSQRTASPGFTQHIVDLGVVQALTLVFKTGLYKLVHPDQVNRLILHTPDSLYQCITSKPAVYQNVINTKTPINGREEHPQHHLNLVRVQLFYTLGCVGVFDTLAAVLPFEFFSGHTKRTFFILPFLPVKTEIQGYGGLTVPVHHNQQLESKHIAVRHVIPHAPYFLHTFARLGQGGVIEDKVTG